MIKHIIFTSFLAIILAIGMSTAAIAETSTDKTMEEKYFTGPNPIFTMLEQAAIKITEKLNEPSQVAVKPILGRDGSVKFLFGSSQPSVICAVMQVCDVALQKGEVVNSIHLGDTARWIVDPAVTGSGFDTIQHLIIKPMDVGLTTSLIVTTDRRTYHMRLRSHRSKYMPRVSFTYTDDAMQKWEKLKAEEQLKREANTIPETGEYLGDLDFNYSVDGITTWKPLRVFNDGKKTIIEMPKTMEQIEAPALLVVREEGGLFSDDETVMINYRVINNRYIVDTVFDKAIMVAGVGSKQHKVTISRSEKEAQ